MELTEYARRHPRTAASLMRLVGQDVDGSTAAYQRVGSDPSTASPSWPCGPGEPVVADLVAGYWVSRNGG